MNVAARCAATILGGALAASILAACGGSPNTPVGSVVNSPGSGGTSSPSHKVNATVTIVLETNAGASRSPHYLSPRTGSVAVQTVAVNGSAVTDVSSTTINIAAHAPHCRASTAQLVCTGTVVAVAGKDTFDVTAFAWPNGTGAVLASGQVFASIGSSSGNLRIDGSLTPWVGGVIAALGLALSPSSAKGGKPVSSQVRLSAFDASGAAIDGSAPFVNPVTLSIEGDTESAFSLRSGSEHGTSVTIDRPLNAAVLVYDGNAKASSITLLASTPAGASAASSATATFTLGNASPPPNAQAIYVLNRGANAGRGATVTVYAPAANGNVAPSRTLNLDALLYAQSIAVDASQRVYVGYFDSTLGFNASNGAPDSGNLIAIYAPNASGAAKPQTTIVADTGSNTALFPLSLAFDPAGDLVTFGATDVDANQGDAAVLVYGAGSSGAAVPAHAWDFGSPYIHFPGPTGLALDAQGNFYVNGALKTSLGPQNGVYIAPATGRDSPSVTASRVIPWTTTTGLTAGQVNDIGLDASGDVYVANFVSATGGGCQAQVNVFASGATGGTTDIPPLRSASLAGFATADTGCLAPGNPTAAAFPAIAVYGASVYAANDFGDAIAVYALGASGTVTPTQSITGSATGLDVPIGIAVGATSNSGRAAARPAKPHHSLPNSSKG